MVQKIVLRYFNNKLNIALNDWRVVYSLEGSPVQLNPEIHRGRLVYRAKGSSFRVSYHQVKTGLTRKNISIEISKPDWL